MAISVFPTCDATVARLSTRSNCSDELQLFTFWFGSGLFATRFRIPVTGFALEVGGNYQFLHTLNDLVYFYSFGDRVGELNITGMAFIRRSCDTGFGVNTALPSYFNPFNWNINPINSDFWNDERWVQTKEWRVRLWQQHDAICDLWRFYQTNRAARSQQALTVQWGQCQSFHAFLTGMRVEIARPDIPVAQFVLRLHVIPKTGLFT